MVSSSALKSNATARSRAKSKRKPSRITLPPELVRQSLRPVTKQSDLFTALKPKQRRGVIEACKHDGFALLFEQRVGKTWVAGGVMERRDAHEVFIVCRKTNLISTWARFIAKRLPHYKIFTDWVEYREHQKGFVKAWGIRDYCVLLVNYEALPSFADKIRKYAWDMVIYDEAQGLKARNSRNSRMARKLRNVKVRLALTGTPMDDSPNDFWAIMRFVDWTLLGESWTEYAKDWCRSTGYMGYKKEFREELREEFLDVISDHVYRVTKEDVGIKRAVIERVPVGMFGRQARIYRALEDDMVAWVGKHRIKTPLKITQIKKLQQITGGFVYTEQKEVRTLGDAKARKLRWMLKTAKPPFIIFALSTPEVEIAHEVASELFDNVQILWGKVKDTRKDPARTRMLEAFQRGEIDGMVCQQRTGGVGVDMFKARTGYIYSCNHSWIDFDQMTSRMDAYDQEKAAKFFHLFVPDTIDEDVIVALDGKRSVTGVTLERLRQRRL